MDFSAQTINKLAINESTIGDAFVQNMQGAWDDRARGLMRAFAKANPKGFGKLSVKLQQLQIDLDTAAIHRIIDAFTAQLHLPSNALEMLFVFLQDTKAQSLLKELEQASTEQSSQWVAAMHCMMNHLQILSSGNLEEQWIRRTLTLMLQRGTQNAAQDLKKIFFRQSEISAIIDCIAHQCDLADHILYGGVRHMDCLELFFLFTNFAKSTPMKATSNQTLLRDIHASLLIARICKESPHAFYDVVRAKESAAFDAMDTPYLQHFFAESQLFKAYFAGQYNKTNREIFVSRLAPKIDALLDSDKVPSNDRMQEILEKVYQDLLIAHKNNSGRIRAAALQLLALGFSHRSAFATTNGNFMPLVNTDVINIDVANTKSLLDFFSQQSRAEKDKLTAEIVGLTLRSTKPKGNAAVTTAAPIEATLRYQISRPWQKTVPLFQQFQRHFVNTAMPHDHWP